MASSYLICEQQCSALLSTAHILSRGLKIVYLPFKILLCFCFLCQKWNFSTFVLIAKRKNGKAKSECDSIKN